MSAAIFSTVKSSTVKYLLQPTSDAWIEQAIANLDIVMLDHSHCERKAAGVALNMMFRYPSKSKMVKALTAISQEELQHFELVNQWLERLDIPLAPLSSPPYGAGLKAQVRKQEPHRYLDSLLVAGLIEARSHERLGLLAEHISDRHIAGFYRSLMASEARHYGAYWVLANDEFERQELTDRLHELAVVESELLSTLHPEPRVHS
ncbi:MAG: tRNA isopentenyl-2-thiomethyl-A-37 hydroxylase MiaE [Cyanobacteria bacterium J06648_11]